MTVDNLIYEGCDLGAVYSKDFTTFRVWAPTADEVSVCLYQTGAGDSFRKKIPMCKKEAGTWFAKEDKDLDGIYYTYLVTVEGQTWETGDPYARACGVNGIRSMVVDLEKTNPVGFVHETRPQVESPVDAVVCEISIADMTGSEQSGVKEEYRGKFLGLTQEHTVSPEGMATGLDHLAELGITHVQLMPSYDFGSVDESDTSGSQYNWGYDPVNYNVPEGSYSTDPFRGDVRIREMKEMIHAFHKKGIGVIMDVVYNHTFDVENSTFQKTAPDAYYRKTEDGYSNASACGNEVASDRPMVRKYIVDSVCYWAKEYHIDGFRFDLMAVLDIETMKAVRNALNEIDPKILVYGEGWAGGDSVYPAELRAFKTSISKLDGVAAFSDDIRDGVRGHVFYSKETGFVNGKKNAENDIKFCIVGGVMHPQVDYTAYTYTPSGPWAKNPLDTVNYISCHDNLTLWDKLRVTCPHATEEELLAMNRLAATIVFTSQGMPFFLSGEEFGRSKPQEGSSEPSENSFNLSGYTNFLRYSDLKKHESLYRYYQGLIALRKKYKGFRLTEAEEVRQSIRFLKTEDADVVAYLITTEEEQIFVAHNAAKEPTLIDIPIEGEFQIVLDGDRADEFICSIANQALVKPVSSLIAVRAKQLQ